MKKFLLGTTALVGASVVASSAMAMPIQSKSEEGTPILTASIVAQFEGGIADNDAAAKTADGSSRDGGFVNGRFAEVFFNGELTADNGLVYGARLHFGTGGDGSAATNVTTTGFPGREYIYFQGGWGTVNLGNWPGADTLLNICLVCNTYYGYGGFDTPWRSYAFNNGRGPGFGNMTVNQNWFNYSIKATYLTPVIAGFQAGVSYSPERTSTPATTFNDNNGNDKDLLGAGVKWTGDFGDVSLSVSAIGTIGSGDQTTSYSGTINNAAALDTRGQGLYEIGAVVRYAGFHFGGSYWDDGTGGSRPGRDFQFESDGWTLDGGYKTGPFAIELQYINSHRQGSSGIFSTAVGNRQVAGVVGGVAGANANNAVEQFDQQGFLAAFGYDVAPGLKWYVEVGHFDFDYTPHSIPGLAPPTGIDNSGIVGISGVVLSF